ncbi:MAG: DNA polymerase III subunit alpha [Clostridia bacterium]|nr:DNA polymerase III subunit alpha [Clostridia bacterium]
MSFVHLHIHTEFSFLDGACRIPALISRAKELGQTAIAITDHGGMYGIVDFYKEAINAGIKPIIGCEVYTAARSMYDKTHEMGNRTGHLVLLAKNDEGYKNLIKIVSEGFTNGFYYKPRVDFDMIKRFSGGLIALSACLAGDIPQAIMADDLEKAKKLIQDYIDVFGKENFFLEIQDHGIAEQKKVNTALIRLSEQFGIGLVATNDVHYVNKDDAKHQDVLMCIQTNRKVSETDRMSFETDEFYLKSEDEMLKMFKNVPEALENTQKIADMCNFDIKFHQHLLPEYDVPNGEDAYSYLKRLCEEGYAKRYKTDDHKERLYYELDVIKNMGYVDYFLIVRDFIKYAKDHGIPVGPGRGSAAGSIVSYCLAITNIDPIRYNLLFERFLNPERVSMPDIDVDICNENRQKVIDYVVSKYGRDRVVQIITFNAMKAKAAVRDVGRVLDITYQETDAIAKMIPFELKMTIEKALSMNPELKALYEENPQARELLTEAMALEGLTRNAGTHAAGVVISKNPITEHIPIQKNDDIVTTQFPMGTVEELGLLKMDFLGLRNLSIIDDAIKIIEKSTGEKIDIDKINVDIPEVYKMLSRGETEGVFQLESAGMRSFMKELKPESLEDIIAGISLYRPGPMEQIPRYIANKNNPKSVTYKHPLLEKILDVTYGCMVYQEQVMQIVRELGGYSLGRADLVRRAMSKKKADVMTEERKHFIHGLTDDDGNILIDGAIRRGVSEKVANDIFDEMMDFANYAFNKSHAAAYSVVTYQTAYLKYFYPAQYMAALLSSVLDSPEKVARYSAECARMGIKILPPDINESYSGFTVSNGDVRFGMAVIKNVGVGVIDAIAKERQLNGKFTSYDDFINRTVSLGVSKRVHEQLIKSGVFDSLGHKRSQLLSVFEKRVDAAADNRKHNVEGQISLFDFGKEEESVQEALPYPDIEEFPQKKMLSMEKETIGFYVSGHPLNEYRDKLDRLSTHYAIDFSQAEDEADEILKDIKDGDKVSICGIISELKTKITRSNQMMAFIGLEDMTGKLEALVFPLIYKNVKPYISEDAIVVVSGRISMREDEAPKLLADTVIPIEEALKQDVSGKLYIRFELGKAFLYERAKEIMEKTKGNIAVCIHDEETGKTSIAPKNLWVSENAKEELTELLGEKNVVYKSVNK